MCERCSSSFQQILVAVFRVYSDARSVMTANLMETLNLKSASPFLSLFRNARGVILLVTNIDIKKGKAETCQIKYEKFLKSRLFMMHASGTTI